MKIAHLVDCGLGDLTKLNLRGARHLRASNITFTHQPGISLEDRWGLDRTRGQVGDSASVAPSRQVVKSLQPGGAALRSERRQYSMWTKRTQG